MADERWSSDSPGTEVSGGTVHRDFHDVSRPDGTTHHITQSLLQQKGEVLVCHGIQTQMGKIPISTVIITEDNQTFNLGAGREDNILNILPCQCTFEYKDKNAKISLFCSR